jgi:uncharacterized protein (DUF1778 family)
MNDVAIKLWATPAQHDLVARASTLLRTSPSEFVLEAACEHARSVVLGRVALSVDPSKFQQFASALDAPAGCNLGLQRLMAVRAPWSINE